MEKVIKKQKAKSLSAILKKSPGNDPGIEREGSTSIVEISDPVEGVSFAGRILKQSKVFLDIAAFF
ncbi:MAG: hypothetical protein ACOYMB_00295 [Patescibacteria group bacterium]